MNTPVTKASTLTRISRDRLLSVTLWEDTTTQICLDGAGMSQVIHLNKEDTEILIKALRGDSHA